LKQAYFDCSSGISGDMILGALVDCGVKLTDISNALRDLPIKGYELTESETKRNGLRCRKVDVLIKEKQHSHAHFSHIKNMVEQSALPSYVKEQSIRIFLKIAEAEAKVHGTDIEKVHFHEVGAIDSICDIVGGIFALSLLGIQNIISSPLNLGSGTVNCAHGVLPVPAPATSEIVKGSLVYSSSVEKELTTPTGAAFITTLASSFGTTPLMKLETIGCGAGSYEIKGHANMLRVFVGESNSDSNRDSVSVIETNIDDVTPQVYDLLIDKLFSSGALDVFLTPIIMKKTRPAVKISVISTPSLEKELIRILFSETSTFGVRTYTATRDILEREIVQIDTKFGKIMFKRGTLNGKSFTISPEYEDCKRIALEKGLSFKEVYLEALKSIRY
jgi:uncharacterized protein (TIGR00299 family) protein